MDVRALPTIAARCHALLRWYQRFGRHHLPWRRTRDPYAILVSEIMLQQTQVDRVIPYWNAWMRRWPTVESLARARRASVIRAWAGLGYNRRAVYLHRAARVIARSGWPSEIAAVWSTSGRTTTDRKSRSRFSVRTCDEGSRRDECAADHVAALARALQRLPGIGPYTANALLAFARNLPAPCVDTNVRRVLSHVIYRRPSIMRLPSRAVERLAARVIPPGEGRAWNYTLMDYGALVLRAQDVPNPSVRRTQPFNDSTRFWRGRIVAALRETRRPLAREQLLRALASYGDPPDTLDDLLSALARDGVIQHRGGGFMLA